jgi:CdiI immunity protein
MKSFEPIESLFGYLHEDWADDYADAWMAVEDFATGQPAEAPLLRGDVEALVKQYSSDPELEHRLFNLGLRYRPAADGWSSERVWLLAVADRVEQTLRRTPAA